MNKIKDQLPYTLNEFNALELGKHYKGKVRENFHIVAKCVTGVLLRVTRTSPVHARPVEAPTSRFDGRGCPVHRHPRPRAEEAGRISSTRLLQLADVERLPRAKNEIWYQGSETPRSGRRVTRVVSQAA